MTESTTSTHTTPARIGMNAAPAAAPVLGPPTPPDRQLVGGETVVWHGEPLATDPRTAHRTLVGRRWP